MNDRDEKGSPQKDAEVWLNFRDNVFALAGMCLQRGMTLDKVILDLHEVAHMLQGQRDKIEAMLSELDNIAVRLDAEETKGPVQ